MVRISDRSGGRCCACWRVVDGPLSPRYDHIIAIANGGANREYNIQLLCPACHRDKNKDDMRVKRKIVRTRMKHFGIKPKKGRPMPGTKRSGLRKRMDGTVERR